MRWRLLFGLAMVLAVSAVGAGSAGAVVPGQNGQVVFQRFDPSIHDSAIFTMNPDGSHVQELVSQGAPALPLWSPDGTQVSIQCCDDGMAAHIVDVATGVVRDLAQPDPALEANCDQWSPNGLRLACETFGASDPSLNGIYSIRASDGGGVARITSNPGGDDLPLDYSPDGSRLAFVRFDSDGVVVGLFVVTVNTGAVRMITPPGMIVNDEFGGSWSPTGNHILFVARSSPDNRRAIWVVNSDGSRLHQLAISPACGGLRSDHNSLACTDPNWSPNGRKIIFTRTSANGTKSNIYTVNPDGGDLTRVTQNPNDSQPNWGTRPSR